MSKDNHLVNCSISIPVFASESFMGLTQHPVVGAKVIVGQIHPHKDNEPKCQVSTGSKIHWVRKVTGDKWDEALNRSSMVMWSDSRRAETPPPIPLFHNWLPVTFSTTCAKSNDEWWYCVSAVIGMWENYGVAGPEQDRPPSETGGDPQPGQLLQGAHARAEGQGCEGTVQLWSPRYVHGTGASLWQVCVLQEY